MVCMYLPANVFYNLYCLVLGYFLIGAVGALVFRKLSGNLRFPLFIVYTIMFLVAVLYLNTATHAPTVTDFAKCDTIQAPFGR